jgi:hypothetical protein
MLSREMLRLELQLIDFGVIQAPQGHDPELMRLNRKLLKLSRHGLHQAYVTS